MKKLKHPPFPNDSIRESISPLSSPSDRRILSVKCGKLEERLFGDFGEDLPNKEGVVINLLTLLESKESHQSISEAIQIWEETSRNITSIQKYSPHIEEELEKWIIHSIKEEDYAVKGFKDIVIMLAASLPKIALEDLDKFRNVCKLAERSIKCLISLKNCEIDSIVILYQTLLELSCDKTLFSLLEKVLIQIESLIFGIMIYSLSSGKNTTALRWMIYLWIWGFKKEIEVRLYKNIEENLIDYIRTSSNGSKIKQHMTTFNGLQFASQIYENSYTHKLYIPHSQPLIFPLLLSSINEKMASNMMLNIYQLFLIFFKAHTPQTKQSQTLLYTLLFSLPNSALSIPTFLSYFPTFSSANLILALNCAISRAQSPASILFTPWLLSHALSLCLIAESPLKSLKNFIFALNKIFVESKDLIHKNSNFFVQFIDSFERAFREVLAQKGDVFAVCKLLGNLVARYSSAIDPEAENRKLMEYLISCSDAAFRWFFSISNKQRVEIGFGDDLIIFKEAHAQNLTVEKVCTELKILEISSQIKDHLLSKVRILNSESRVETINYIKNEFAHLSDLLKKYSINPMNGLMLTELFQVISSIPEGTQEVILAALSPVGKYLVVVNFPTKAQNEVQDYDHILDNMDLEKIEEESKLYSIAQNEIKKVKDSISSLRLTQDMVEGVIDWLFSDYSDAGSHDEYSLLALGYFSGFYKNVIKKLENIRPIRYYKQRNLGISSLGILLSNPKYPDLMVSHILIRGALMEYLSDPILDLLSKIFLKYGASVCSPLKTTLKSIGSASFILSNLSQNFKQHSGYLMKEIIAIISELNDSKNGMQPLVVEQILLSSSSVARIVTYKNLLRFIQLSIEEANGSATLTRTLLRLFWAMISPNSIKIDLIGFNNILSLKPKNLVLFESNSQLRELNFDLFPRFRSMNRNEEYCRTILGYRAYCSKNILDKSHILLRRLPLNISNLKEQVTEYLSFRDFLIGAILLAVHCGINLKLRGLDKDFTTAAKKYSYAFFETYKSTSYRLLDVVPSLVYSPNAHSPILDIMNALYFLDDYHLDKSNIELRTWIVDAISPYLDNNG